MSSKLIAKLPGAKHVCYFIINAIIVYLTKPFPVQERIKLPSNLYLSIIEGLLLVLWYEFC